MAQPTPYDRQYSFSGWQAGHPADPLPGNEVDAELDAVKATLDETLANLASIQRDDGRLANGSVGLDQLASDVTIGVQPATQWAADTDYLENNIVFYGVVLYRCTTAHTSTDSFDASKFAELADLSSIVIAPGSVGTAALGDGVVTGPKVGDGAVTPTKMSGFPGSALAGRYSASSGAPQAILLGSGLSFSDNTLVASTSVADGGVTTAKLADAAVTNAKCASGLAVANLGFTPINRAGDSNISGVLQRNGQGAHLWHGGSYTSGKVTISASDPSGGSDGDIWFKILS